MEFKENQLLNLAFVMITVYPPGYWVYVMFVNVLLSSLIKQVDEITEYAQIDTQNMQLGMHIKNPLKRNIHPQAN